MTEHQYDHVMAWSSLWILFPLAYTYTLSIETVTLSVTMILFTVISVQHWRHYSVRWLHALDVVVAHIVFVWHLSIAIRTLPLLEWTLCVRYAITSGAFFLTNELLLHCRARAVASGDAWRWIHLVPHATFRYYAFAMVMTVRRSSWTWKFLASYVASIVVLCL